MALARALAPRVGAAHPTLLTTVALRYLAPLGVIGVTLVASWEPLSRAVPPSAWELAVMVSSLATFAACATGVGVLLPSMQRAR